MKLTLKNGNGESLLVDLEPQDTFQDLKNRLKRDYGIPLDMQSLKFKGDRPVDSQNVLEYINKASKENHPIENKSVAACHLCTSKNSKHMDLKIDSKSLKRMLESDDFTAGGKCSVKLAAGGDISSANICADCANMSKQCQKLRDTCTEAQCDLEPLPMPFNQDIDKNQEIGPICHAINVDSSVSTKGTGEKDDSNQILLNITDKNSESIVISKLPDHADTPLKLTSNIILDESNFQVGIKQIEYEFNSIDKYFTINDSNKAGISTSNDSSLKQSMKASFSDRAKAIDLRAVDSEDQYMFQENIEEIMKCQSTDGGASSRPELVGCQKCSEAFMSLKRLWAHSAIHHLEEDKQSSTGLLYPCGFCDGKFTHLQPYAKHFDSEHSNYSGKPPSPQKSDASAEGDGQAEMCQVSSSCEQVITLKNACNLGKIIVKPPCSLNSDQSDVRALALLYECERCAVKFAKVTALLAHRSHCLMKKSASVSPHQEAAEVKASVPIASIFVCGACCNVCSSRGELMAHTVSCPVDADTTLTTTSSTNKLWNCRSCNQLFPSARELYRHKRGEDRIGSNTTELTTYICVRCEKAFGSTCALRTHVKMHSKSKAGYPCKVCDRRFNQSGHLTIHMRIHTGERPYPCGMCTKAFKVKIERDDHRRTHTGERPFACGTCGKTFTASARLREHKIIHTDQRPYVCNICGAAFRRPYARTVHNLIHTGEKPHDCNVCGTAFRRTGDMWKHKRTLHGITPPHKSRAGVV